MLFMTCVVPVCPLRAEPAHRSEQTTQLLFGEIAAATEMVKDFIKVRCLHDDYEGWCQAAQLEEITAAQAAGNRKRLSAHWQNEVKVNGQVMHIPFGASLGLLQNGEGKWGRYDISYQGAVTEPDNNDMSEQLIKDFALMYLNTPYLWGGRSVFGVDCSGFTQGVFRCMNIPLPRDSCQQGLAGRAIGFLQEARCGDLAFFDNEVGKIVHVGILLDSGSIIHASGKVRVDAIDNFGIINSDTGKRTHNLRVIRRME